MQPIVRSILGIAGASLLIGGEALWAQYKPFWEVGVMGGVSAYHGDLTEGVLDRPHVAAGALLRYHYSPGLVFKANIYYGTLSGDDARASDPQRRMRNLSFRSPVIDMALTAELNLARFSPSVRSYAQTTPYLFAGLNLFRFNPHTLYDGRWIPLQPLGTEGQGTIYYDDRQPYPLTQVAIPFGVGIRSMVGSRIVVGAELGLRKTFTDYIDDVSRTYVEKEILLAERGALAWELSVRMDEYLGEEVIPSPSTYRGDPTTKDWYGIGGITVSYLLIKSQCFWY